MNNEKIAPNSGISKFSNELKIVNPPIYITKLLNDFSDLGDQTNINNELCLLKDFLEHDKKLKKIFLYFNWDEKINLFHQQISLKDLIETINKEYFELPQVFLYENKIEHKSFKNEINRKSSEEIKNSQALDNNISLEQINFNKISQMQVPLKKQTTLEEPSNDKNDNIQNKEFSSNQNNKIVELFHEINKLDKNISEIDSQAQEKASVGNILFGEDIIMKNIEEQTYEDKIINGSGNTNELIPKNSIIQTSNKKAGLAFKNIEEVSSNIGQDENYEDSSTILKKPIATSLVNSFQMEYNNDNKMLHTMMNNNMHPFYSIPYTNSPNLNYSKLYNVNLHGGVNINSSTPFANCQEEISRETYPLNKSLNNCEENLNCQLKSNSFPKSNFTKIFFPSSGAFSANLSNSGKGISNPSSNKTLGFHSPNASSFHLNKHFNLNNISVPNFNSIDSNEKMVLNKTSFNNLSIPNYSKSNPGSYQSQKVYYANIPNFTAKNLSFFDSEYNNQNNKNINPTNNHTSSYPRYQGTKSNADNKKIDNFNNYSTFPTQIYLNENNENNDKNQQNKNIKKTMNNINSNNNKNIEEMKNSGKEKYDKVKKNEMSHKSKNSSDSKSISKATITHPQPEYNPNVGIVDCSYKNQFNLVINKNILYESLNDGSINKENKNDNIIKPKISESNIDLSNRLINSTIILKESGRTKRNILKNKRFFDDEHIHLDRNMKKIKMLKNCLNSVKTHPQINSNLDEIKEEYKFHNSSNNHPKKFPKKKKFILEKDKRNNPKYNTKANFKKMKIDKHEQTIKTNSIQLKNKDNLKEDKDASVDKGIFVNNNRSHNKAASNSEDSENSINTSSSQHSSDSLEESDSMSDSIHEFYNLSLNEARRKVKSSSNKLKSNLNISSINCFNQSLIEYKNNKKCLNPSRNTSYGLKEISKNVLKIVKKFKSTTYKDISDMIVVNINLGLNGAKDEKNIRRRIYDSLNVMKAMNIFKKEKNMKNIVLNETPQIELLLKMLDDDDSSESKDSAEKNNKFKKCFTPNSNKNTHFNTSHTKLSPDLNQSKNNIKNEKELMFSVYDKRIEDDKENFNGNGNSNINLFNKAKEKKAYNRLGENKNANNIHIKINDSHPHQENFSDIYDNKNASSVDIKKNSENTLNGDKSEYKEYKSKGFNSNKRPHNNNLTSKSILNRIDDNLDLLPKNFEKELNLNKLDPKSKKDLLEQIKNKIVL